MSARHPTRLLDDILAAIARIHTYRAVAPDVPADVMSDAVLRRLASIGEAAARLDAAERALAPDVPWKDIIELRNRVVHDDDRIDWEIIEDVIENDLTLLALHITALRSLLAGDRHSVRPRPAAANGARLVNTTRDNSPVNTRLTWAERR